jgi:hypothetical protein
VFPIYRISLDQIEFLSYGCVVPFLPRGRLAIVTDSERDAVDVECAFDERRVTRTAKSCGPDAPTLASSRWKTIPLMTVANKPVTGESTE